MLKKDNRLTKDKDFDKVFKQGKGVFLGILGVRAVKNDLKKNRYGILVGEKVSKKAVIRNKIKRRLRQAINNSVDEVKKGFDIVVTTTPAIKEKEFVEIETTIKKGLERLKLANK